MFSELAFYRFEHILMPRLKLSREEEVALKHYPVSQDNKTFIQRLLFCARVLSFDAE